MLLINFKYSLDSTKKFGQVNKILCEFNKTILFNEHFFSKYGVSIGNLFLVYIYNDYCRFWHLTKYLSKCESSSHKLYFSVPFKTSTPSRRHKVGGSRDYGRAIIVITFADRPLLKRQSWTIDSIITAKT